jgi:phage-related protein
VSGQPLGVGMWQNARHLTQDVTAEDTTLYLDTTGMDFRVGSNAILWSAWNDTEIVAVTEVTDTSLTLMSPTEKSFLAVEAYCVPMQLCVAQDGGTFKRYQNNVSDWSVQWNSEETTADLADYSEQYSTTFRGVPVLTDLLLLSEDTMNESLNSDFIKTDFETGIVDYKSRKAVGVASTTKMWEIDGDTALVDAMALRKFIYWARGRQHSFWSPSRRADFRALEGTTAGSSALEVYNNGYAGNVGINAPYNVVQFTMTDGTILHREILTATDGVDEDSGVTTLTFDDTFPSTQPFGYIKQICFLFLSRFAADETKIKHNGQGRITVSSPIVGVKQ